ncbi:MAG: aldo/keto reductase [Planctomycetota bacterium]
MGNSPDPSSLADVDLPKLIFGSGSLGNLYKAASDAEKLECIESWFQSSALPLVIDSAGKYGAGMALSVLGRHLESLGIDPSDVIINNKLGWRQTPLEGPEPTFEPGVWFDIEHDAVQDISASGIRRCFEQGEELLGKFGSRLLSVHDPDEFLVDGPPEERDRRLADVLAAYEELRTIQSERGLLGVGVGAKDWRVIAEIDSHIKLDWAMFANSWTILDHPAELSAVFDDLQKRGVVVFNSAVLHGGFLSGGQFIDYQKVDPSNPSHAVKIEKRDRLRAICEQHGVSVFHAAVQFGLCHPAIQSVALSSTKPERTKSMVAAVNEPLPGEFWGALQGAGVIEPRDEITNWLVQNKRES